MIKIDKKIVGYAVEKAKEEKEEAKREFAREGGGDRAEVIRMHEKLERPEMLVGSTRKVATGDLEFRLPEKGTGEVGELVRSFDNMVSRLADQRRDLARLERAAAWRGMARTLAHEVKNPLAGILGYAQLTLKIGRASCRERG